MAPSCLFVFTLICLLNFHVSRTHSRTSPCSDRECRKTVCPSVCSCLGSFVDCSKKELIAIPSDLPIWVEILDLQKNVIIFPNCDALAGLQNLTELNLSNNDLKTFNCSFQSPVSSLQKLNVHKSYLTELPSFQFQNLSVINLEHNKIQRLNSDFDLKAFPNLHVLDLSFNLLIDLPANTFGRSASLRHLHLSHNRIASMDKTVFANLTTLESLKMNRNRLSHIPKELFRHLNSLLHLEMNSNSLTQIEGLSFQGLASLLVLKLRHSSISHLLDGAFYGLNNIKKLQLDYNNITKITKGWLYGLHSLQRLYLNNNNITDIEDDAWDSTKRLLELDLARNNVHFITTKTFEKLYSLKRLILNNNRISYIEEGAFRSLSALQYLDFNSNELSWVIEDTGKIFSGLDRLRFLSLSNNNVKAVVRRAFSGLTRLETLNLTENKITSIEQDAFVDLSSLQQLLINTSSLICDCDLVWMTESFDYSVVAKCGFPRALSGHSVFEVPSENFHCGSPKPSIIKEPITKISLKGENVTLECQARSSGLADIKYFWKKDGKLLNDMWLWHKTKEVRTGNVTMHSSWLSIQEIQNKDEGRYQCVIANQFGSVYSNKARITVHVYPVFTKTPTDVAIKSGSTARLECGAMGQPVPDITWRKDGGDDFPAARERRMHVMLPTDDLFFIVGVKASDTGVYSCTARNVAGVITANATLTVLETPSFAKKMTDKEVVAGETAVLECMAAGSPKPKLAWFKDGTSLIPTERHFFTGGNQLLIIIRSKASDSGSYTCRMSNTLGADQGTSNLKVISAYQSGGGGLDDNNMTGIIVIAVVVCVVGTSIVWVIVIHHTRKTREDFIASTPSGTNVAADIQSFSPYRNVCAKDFKQTVAHMYLDSHSGHSKDSGTGDSAQPSSDDLLIEEDDRGLLLDMHPSSGHTVSSLFDLQNKIACGGVLGEQYASSNSSASKERVPLLTSFRTSRSQWKSHRKSIAEFRQQQLDEIDNFSLLCSDRKWPCVLVQRSLSADQVNSHDVLLHHRGCSEPPQDSVISQLKNEAGERDSGFSTFPRSITQASVNNWGSGSPRLHRLPKDIPNDSGSFSIASEDVHIQVNPLLCVSSDAPVLSTTTRTNKAFVGGVAEQNT